jgi:two-component system, NarL family, sensor histidine kinase FusK
MNPAGRGEKLLDCAVRWKRKMAKDARSNSLWTQLAVAAGYALAYLAVRPFSDAHWALTSGLRLACLLLFPYRCWAALAIGEFVPLVWLNSGFMAPLGGFTVALWSIPPIATGMPVVWWCRRHLAIFPSRSQLDIQPLLLCVAMLSVVWAVITYLGLSHVHWPAMMARPHYLLIIGLTIGNYVAMLTLVPCVLLVRMGDQPPWRWRELMRGDWCRDVLFRALPALIALALLSGASRGDVQQIARMLMLFPVTWLTLKHGWRGAVVGSSLTMAGVCVLLESRPSSGILQTQAFMGIAITCLLGLGAHISAQRQQREKERLAYASAQHLARKSLLLGEQRMQQTSQALACVASIMRIDYGHLLENFVPDEQRHGYHRLAEELEQRVRHLAESLRPSAWHERGLQAALHDAIGRALNGAGLSYSCEVTGRRLNFLSEALQAAIYRTVCELVVGISSPLACRHIHLLVRVARIRSRNWVLLRLDGVLDDTNIANAIFHSRQREHLASTLGALFLQVDELRDLIRLFDGELRVRPSKENVRMSVLLRDDSPQAARGDLIADGIRLRVQ